MNAILDDFDFDNNLPQQESPKPIKGKVKKNIQRWILAAVLLVATPIAIWQGLKEEKAGQEDWKVKEQERTAAQARGNQAGGESVKEIAVIAEQQKQQADMDAKPVVSAASSVPAVKSGPLPGPPQTAEEEFPITPSYKATPGEEGAPSAASKLQSEINTQIASSSIIALSGGEKQKDSGKTPANLSPEMFIPKEPPQASPLSSLDVMNAMKPQAPMSRADAARQWMKEQQKSESDSNGVYAKPPHNDTVIMEGTMLDAVFLTAVNTDLPGEVSAIITRDVYDSMEPEKYLLIPKGSKLIGSYNSEVNIGQERIMMAFKRLIFPDGSSINLLGMAGTDAMGRSGLTGDVDNHFFKMFGASFLIAGISKLVTPKQPANVNVYAQGGGQLTTEAGAILSDISGRILRRNENISPTISIAAGERFNVRVSKDMHLPPYR